MSFITEELSINLPFKGQFKDDSALGRQQRRVLDLFLDGEKRLVEFVRQSKALNRLKEGYQKFLDRNSNLDVLSDDIENKSRTSRLNKRKWFTIAAEAVLSYTGIRFFLTETLNTSFPFLPTFLLALILAYLLLDMAIEYRMDDESTTDSGFAILDSIKRYSFVLSLIIIPGLNIFIIMSTPDNPMNFLYIFFAIISLMLNLKAASYYKEFRTLRNAQLAQKVNTKWESQITTLQKKVDRIETEILELRNTISKEAVSLRRIYESLPVDSRKLTIPAKFIFIMNNKIFFTEVFEIPKLIQRTPPKGELADSINDWNIFFSTPSSNVGTQNNNDEADKKLTGPDSAEKNISESSNTDTNNKSESIDKNSDRSNYINEDNDDDSDFGTIISDNEKFL